MTERLLSIALGVGVALSAHGQSCDCDVSDRFEASYDALLELNADERERALRLHLPWGTPTSASGATLERVLANDDYVVCHDGDLRVPLWGAYRLDWFDVDHDRKRTECFRPDPRLDADESASCADYKRSGFARGHIVPSDAVGRTESSMVNTYLFSNMAPMENSFNSGIWKRLEDHARSWAKERGPLWVIAGSVFDADDDGTRDPDALAQRLDGDEPGRVAIPTHYYMIIATAQQDGSLDTLAFLLPHSTAGVPSGAANKDAWLRDNALVSIRLIEEVTGHDFFPGRDDADEALFESAIATELW